MGTCKLRSSADAQVDSIYAWNVVNCSGYEATTYLCGRCKAGYAPNIYDTTSIRSCGAGTVANCMTVATNEVNMCRACNSGYTLAVYDSTK